MHHLGKRIWLLLAIGALGVPVAATGLAHACTGLATVTTNPGAGAAGDTVTLSGKGFAPHDSSDVRTSSAQVHMDKTDGPVIATADPSSGNTGGTFSVQVTVPQTDAGDHVLIVTQAGLDGRPAYGTPARTVFKVMPTPEPVAPAAQPESQAATPAPAALAAPTLVSPSMALQAPARSTASKTKRSARSRAISRCNSKYSAKKAKTAAGRKRMASKRSACIKRANHTKAASKSSRRS